MKSIVFSLLVTLLFTAYSSVTIYEESGSLVEPVVTAVSQKAFNELQENFGEFYRNLSRQKTWAYSDKSNLQALFDLKSLQPLREKYLPYLQKNAVIAYLFKDVNYDKMGKKGTMVLLIGNSNQVSSVKKKGVILDSIFVPFDFVKVYKQKSVHEPTPDYRICISEMCLFYARLDSFGCEPLIFWLPPGAHCPSGLCDGPPCNGDSDLPEGPSFDIGKVKPLN